MARKADRYVTEDRYPVAVPLPRAVETATCDVDSRGLVWIAYVDQEKLRTVVRVFNPERPADGVGPEIELGAGMSRDDIASVVAFKGHVGVFWSDQKSDHFFFRVHADGEDPAKWAPAETIGSTRGVADDHVNLAADSEGRVWTVTKDGFDQFTLRRRSTDGKWDAAVPILPKEVVATRPGPRADGTRPGGTRPIVVLCEETQTAFVAYTDWAHKPMRVCLHPVSMTSLHVGPMLPIIHGPHGFNNVTSTKAPITRKSGLLLLARGTRTRWVILPLPLLADRR